MLVEEETSVNSEYVPGTSGGDVPAGFSAESVDESVDAGLGGVIRSAIWYKILLCILAGCLALVILLKIIGGCRRMSGYYSSDDESSEGEFHFERKQNIIVDAADMIGSVVVEDNASQPSVVKTAIGVNEVNNDEKHEYKKIEGELHFKREQNPVASLIVNDDSSDGFYFKLEQNPVASVIVDAADMIGSVVVEDNDSQASVVKNNISKSAVVKAGISIFDGLRIFFKGDLARDKLSVTAVKLASTTRRDIRCGARTVIEPFIKLKDKIVELCESRKNFDDSDTLNKDSVKPYPRLNNDSVLAQNAGSGFLPKTPRGDEVSFETPGNTENAEVKK